MTNQMKRLMKKFICVSDANMRMCLHYLLNTRVVNQVDSAEFINDAMIVNMLDGNTYWFEAE